ncbi:TPR domain protein [Glaciecola punicea ACAM 611]|jgi:tetratricopeptide (TPR) repeat protein|uniref:TPR domain protein n=1 Tax=Glaciecola punicea ACAM 611 TaxID=1121923 RepID=H5TCI8_9ALTE|nr:tetratricopeptide repeat-containing sulfotransferase family protein [Glaciecola punicea]GAB56015.1 TPR domain protein [Glaciecola punicea ACAM 611]
MSAYLPSDNIRSEKIIEQAKNLLQKQQYIESIDLLNGLLTQAPDNVDALYIVAVCQRYLNQKDKALSVLKQLKSYHPNYARAFQEEGHNYRSTDYFAAIRSFEQAILLNPTLIASWKSLAELHKIQDNKVASNEAYTQYAYWSNMPKELLSVNSFLCDDKLAKAEDLCRFFLKKHPKNVEAMRLLASIGVKHKVLDDAEFLLESCLTFEPNFHQARSDYVNVLHRRQKYQKALEQADILRRSAPSNLRYQMIFANENQAVGNFDKALDVYKTLLNKIPDDSGVLIMQGHAYKTIGQTENAIIAYRQACISKENFGDAFWSLANLKTYHFTDEEIVKMQAREQAEETLFEDRFHLCFALGKAFEDRGSYTDAFSYYERGNALKKKQLNYSAQQIASQCQAQIEVCKPALFRNKVAHSCQAADPIFIVGLPRSGSTLLEQILSSHSQVDGTMELPNIMALSHRLSGRRSINDTKRYPKVLEELSAEQLKKFGDAFIKDTQVHRKEAPYFIDKMPNNFRHIGLIHLILPNAKIIDARRHPLACCFSGFKQLFAEGQEFSYSLEDIGHYYNDYVQLMDHWDSVLPGKILRVQYEDVVADLEMQVRRLLEFCGLPFEENCLNFHKTKRSVRTASSEQVRQPIYNKGLEHWQKFEEYLEPLKNVLRV